MKRKLLPLPYEFDLVFGIHDSESLTKHIQRTIEIIEVMDHCDPNMISDDELKGLEVVETSLKNLTKTLKKRTKQNA